MSQWRAQATLGDKRFVGAKPFAIALLALWCAVSTCNAANEPGTQSSSCVVDVAGRFATVTASVSISASDDEWSTLALLPASVPLRLVEVKGKRGYVQRGAEAQLCVIWAPKALVAERLPVFEAREDSLISPQQGCISRLSRIEIALQRGELSDLTLEAPEGVDILSVSAASSPSSGRHVRRNKRLRIHSA